MVLVTLTVTPVIAPQRMSFKVRINMFVESQMARSAIFLNPAVMATREDLWARLDHEVIAVSCSDMLLPWHLFSDLPLGFLKRFRLPGATFEAGEEPLLGRIKSRYRMARDRGRSVLFPVVAHTECAAHWGNVDPALIVAKRFAKDIDKDFESCLDVEGHRFLVPIVVLIDTKEKWWTIFNGERSFSTSEFEHECDATAKILVRLQALFIDRSDIGLQTLFALAELLASNVAYVREDRANGSPILWTPENDPGVLIGVGRGWDNVEEEDHVYVVGDHQPGYEDAVLEMISIITAKKRHLQGIITRDTYWGHLLEKHPCEKAESIRRTLKLQQVCDDRIRRKWPLQNVPVIANIFDLDTWDHGFDPESAMRLEQASWAA